MKNNIFKNRTKIELGMTIFIISILVITNIVSSIVPINIGTDSSGNSYFGFSQGMITDSFGNAWEYTGANFVTAINTNNNTNSKLTLPTGNIQINDPIAFIGLGIEGQGCGQYEGNTTITTIVLSDDASITFGRNSYIRNLKIYCDEGWKSDYAVKFLANYSKWPGTTWGANNVIQNVEITNYNSWRYDDAEGLNISAIGSDDDDHISISSFSHIFISGFMDGLVIYSSPNAFITGCHFTDIRLTANENGTTIDGGSDNAFFGIQYQARVSVTNNGIRILRGGGNVFYHYVPWDWGVCPSANKVYFENETRNNKVFMETENFANVYNDGEYNTITNTNSGNNFAHRIGYSMFYNPKFDTNYYEQYYIVDKNNTHATSMDGVDPALVINNFHASYNDETLYLDGITYNIGANYHINAVGDFILRGDNKYNTIITTNTDTSDAQKYAIWNNYAGGNNITVSDITFDADQHREYAFFSKINKHYNWTFINCIFKGANGTRLMELDLVNNVKFIRCEFYGDELELESNKNVSFIDCLFANSGDHALEIISCYNVIIDRCKFLNFADDGIIFNNVHWSEITTCYFDGIDISIYLLNSHNNTIDGNFCNSATGIQESVTGCYNNIISCNNCLGCTTPIDINGGGTIHFNSNKGTVS